MKKCAYCELLCDDLRAHLISEHPNEVGFCVFNTKYKIEGDGNGREKSNCLIIL